MVISLHVIVYAAGETELYSLSFLEAFVEDRKEYLFGIGFQLAFIVVLVEVAALFG